jgi:hypothetical protein
MRLHDLPNVPGEGEIPTERGKAMKTEIERCDVCGWPLREQMKDGCVKGNCSMRPVPRCHVCGLPKGNGDGRCAGHYEGTASDASEASR